MKSELNETEVLYKESGGKLISVSRGSTVPAVRVSDGVLLLVAYGRDLNDGYYNGIGSVISDDRILAELPGVTFLRFVRTDMVRVQVPCHDLDGLRKTLERHGLRLTTTHVDEVSGGETWAWARECLSRHDWDPVAYERERSSSWYQQTVDEIVERGWLHRHGLVDGPGLTAEEVCNWIRRISRGKSSPFQGQTQEALDGLVCIGAVSACEVDGQNRYKIARHAEENDHEE
jgi:hypothetical protein